MTQRQTELNYLNRFKLYYYNYREKKEMKYSQFHVLFTKENQIQCSLIDLEDQKEHIIQLEKNIDLYPITIQFTMNEIIVCKESKDCIHFIQDLVNEPDKYNNYFFTYKGKEYNVIAEILLSFIINQFKQRVEKETILAETVFEIESRDCFLIERITSALEMSGLKNISSKQMIFDYGKQFEAFEEIMEKKEEHERCIYQLERAKQHISDEKKQLLTIEDSKVIDEKTVYELSIQFSTKEKEKMKLYRLDNYCLFIASRYLESLEDHINLTKVSKRLRGNMEKFHYNPISVDKRTIMFFPNVETLHCYNKNDEYLEGRKIIKYIDWNKGWYQMDKKKKKYPSKNIEFKYS